jgi:hypothetical protein
MIDITRSIKACAEYYGEDSSAMESYLVEGEKKALELNNNLRSHLLTIKLFLS